jgi:heat shock protein HslJ
MRLITVAAILVFGVVAGCGRGTAPGGSPGGGPEQLPEGRNFLSTSVAGRDLQPKTRIELSFKDGQIGAYAGCNHLFGNARLEGGQLLVDGVGGTEMACTPELMAQDEWLIDFLTGGPDWQLSGQELTLRNGDIRIGLLDRRSAEPARPLLGTRWQLASLVEGETVSSVPSGARPWITFGKDGMVTGNAGCNSFGGAKGNYTVSGDNIRFGELAVTKMSCGEERDALERTVLGVLSGPVSFRIAGDALTVTHPSGKGLQFRAG